jgi:hypothetical protein
MSADNSLNPRKRGEDKNGEQWTPAVALPLTDLSRPDGAGLQHEIVVIGDAGVHNEPAAGDHEKREESEPGTCEGPPSNRTAQEGQSRQAAAYILSSAVK